MTSMRDVVAFAHRIDQAEVHVLQGTHFIPLEFPDEIMAMLDGLLMRSDLLAWADSDVVERADEETALLQQTALDLTAG